jgi:hypothetical protein
MPYLGSLDIANQALKLMGQPPIERVDEISKANRETSEAYDRLRASELRRAIWKFAKRRSVLRPVEETTRVLDPRPWNEDQLYLEGALARDVNGTIWYSTIPDNIGNPPGASTVWEQYFGPLSVNEWQNDIEYFAGEVVWVNGVHPGSFVAFRSLQSQNTDFPLASTSWDPDTLFALNSIVLHAGASWRSVIPVNRGVEPEDPPLPFDINTTYDVNDTVTGWDRFIYQSLGPGNVGNDPVTSPSQWVNTGKAAGWEREPVMYPSSVKWLPLYSDMRNLRYVYPVGTGPSCQVGTLNVFLLPSSFLRMASTDPKNSARVQSDWVLENDHITSRDPHILLTYVADVHDVSRMDPMFCEGLACRIALACCESITQSTTKLNSIGNQYQTFMKEARMVDAIEDEYEEPPVDDLLLERM